MGDYILHLITSHVSNIYMYNQIVGVHGYKPVVYGDYVLENLNFSRFFHRKDKDDYTRIIRKYPVKLIHGHFGSLGAKACRFAKDYGVPLVTHFRGGDASNDPKVKDRLMKKYERLIKEGSLFVPVCKSLVPMLKELGFPKKKIQVLYGGIDLNDFPFMEREFENKQKFRICFVGKTSPKKGIPTLLKAFARLNKEFGHLELRLISTAPSTLEEQTEFNKITGIIDELNIQHKVFFQFDISNKKLHKELHQAHLFCHPSQTSEGNIEGIPNAIKEAMATGLPAVSTYHAGIPELIKHEHNGLLVRESDDISLSDAMGRLVSSPGLCQRFATEGRATVAEKFNLDKQLKAQKKIYDTLIGRWEPDG